MKCPTGPCSKVLRSKVHHYMAHSVENSDDLDLVPLVAQQTSALNKMCLSAFLNWNYSQPVAHGIFSTGKSQIVESNAVVFQE